MASKSKNPNQNNNRENDSWNERNDLGRFETVSGIGPDERKLPYVITTDDVERFLQKQLDVVLNHVANVGEKRENIEIDVYSQKLSAVFIPFMVLLPPTVLKKKYKNPKIEPIFDNREKTNTENMRPEIKNFLKLYMFSDDDMNAFYNDKVRNQYQLSRVGVTNIKNSRFPKLTNIAGKYELVVVMLDPLRIFHAMLKLEKDRRDYLVNVENCQKIAEGKYRYSLVRELNKRGGKGNVDKNFDHMIMRHLSNRLGQ